MAPEQKSNRPAPAAESGAEYYLDDLAPGDHPHDRLVDVREVQLTLAAVARGEGPLLLRR